MWRLLVRCALLLGLLEVVAAGAGFDIAKARSCSSALNNDLCPAVKGQQETEQCCIVKSEARAGAGETPKCVPDAQQEKFCDHIICMEDLDCAEGKQCCVNADLLVHIPREMRLVTDKTCNVASACSKASDIRLSKSASRSAAMSPKLLEPLAAKSNCPYIAGVKVRSSEEHEAVSVSGYQFPRSKVPTDTNVFDSALFGLFAADYSLSDELNSPTPRPAELKLLRHIYPRLAAAEPILAQLIHEAASNSVPDAALRDFYLCFLASPLVSSDPNHVLNLNSLVRTIQYLMATTLAPPIKVRALRSRFSLGKAVNDPMRWLIDWRDTSYIPLTPIPIFMLRFSPFQTRVDRAKYLMDLNPEAAATFIEGIDTTLDSPDFTLTEKLVESADVTLVSPTSMTLAPHASRALVEKLREWQSDPTRDPFPVEHDLTILPDSLPSILPIELDRSIRHAFQDPSKIFHLWQNVQVAKTAFQELHMQQISAESEHTLVKTRLEASLNSDQVEVSDLTVSRRYKDRIPIPEILDIQSLVDGATEPVKYELMTVFMDEAPSDWFTQWVESSTVGEKAKQTMLIRSRWTQMYSVLTRGQGTDNGWYYYNDNFAGPQTAMTAKAPQPVSDLFSSPQSGVAADWQQKAVMVIYRKVDSSSPSSSPSSAPSSSLERAVDLPVDGVESAPPKGVLEANEHRQRGKRHPVVVVQEEEDVEDV